MRRPAVWWVATAVFITNGIRRRRNAVRFQCLETGRAELGPDETPARTWHWILADGVAVPAPIRRSLERYAESEGLDLLDVVPRDLPPEQALQLVGSTPTGYRPRRLARPITALQAMVVEDAALRRSGMRELALGGSHDAAAMLRLATELARAAPTAKDVVIAGGVRGVADDPSRRHAYLRSRFGPLWSWAVLIPAARLGLLAAGLMLAPVWGALALAAWCLQPVVALAGTPLGPRGVWWRSALRWSIAPATLIRVFAGGWRSGPDAGDSLAPEALRPVYDTLLARGTAPFLEKRRSDCPMCAGGELHVVVRSAELIQCKPGRFVLERCGGCGHVFQNPRLSQEGLDFYYRDFYEGLGRELAHTVFAGDDAAYRGRVAMLDGLIEPRRWLDIGAGHGHFCLVASEQWPETRFDGLDMSTSIEEAQRRGWLTAGYRGRLLDFAAELEGCYDVVSMYHYLEHTRDPLRELDAARSLLVPGGYLLIELPDPECLWGRALGQYWMPWFQPQHQHLMPFENLRRALLDRGFQIVRWDRGGAAQPVNLGAALILLLLRLAPPPGLPWRPRAGWLGRARFHLAVVLAAPFIVAGMVIDHAMLPWVRHGKRSNAYRILARLPGGA